MCNKKRCYYWSFSFSSRNGELRRIRSGISWHLPSGRYLRIVRGNTLLNNSCSAIIIGSRASSESTRMGAPMESCNARAPIILLFSYFVRCPGPTVISSGDAGNGIGSSLRCSVTIVTEGKTKLKIGWKKSQGNNKYIVFKTIVQCGLKQKFSSLTDLCIKSNLC